MREIFQYEILHLPWSHKEWYVTEHMSVRTCAHTHTHTHTHTHAATDAPEKP